MKNVLSTRLLHLVAPFALVFLAACQTAPPTSLGSGDAQASQTRTISTPTETRTISERSTVTSTRSERPSSGTIMRTDQLRVEKELVQAGDVGRNIVYRIIVNATADVTNVRVTETLPSGLEFVSASPSASRSGSEFRWTFPTMSRGDREQIEVTVRPTREGDQEVCTVVTVDNRFCLNLFAGQARLEVVKTGPRQVELNEIATWTVSVTNTGTADATNVVVTDELPEAFEPTSPMRQRLGTIPPGESREVTYTARAVRQGEFTNRARASYDGAPDGVDARGADGEPIHESSSPIRVVQSGIRISHAGPEEAFVFKPESYSIIIENTGDTDLENVRITNQLPSSASVTDPANGRVSGNAIGWMIPNLPAGSSLEINPEITSTQTGPARSSVRLLSASGLEASDSVVTDWKAVPGVTISITDTVDPIRVGEETIYNIVIRNQGDFEPVSGTIEVQFTDQIRAISAGGDSRGVVEENKVTFPRATLEPGRDLNLTITAEGRRLGPGRAILSFSSDFIEEPIISQEATNVY